ncbi:hypothetical protein [Egibacter rhizosphaerae]|uniref:hypothetical protein n=1 Tax=Egibacter rhizosphaerae TaxID=1670831 RepID=UPI0013F14F4E|nr:hypothetical protein [Egibacter rhizosphaerae]
MYQTIGAPAAAGIGALAYTGSDLLWLAVGAFALIAAGSAVLRIIPRRVQA